MTQTHHTSSHPELRRQIAGLIRKSEKGISFAQFMELALYHPEHGYYSRPRRIGRGGDFYTSVSVGECFGLLLARYVQEIWKKTGSREDFTLIEQGAHDGQLAEDILKHLPGGYRYLIVEPNPHFREAQRQRLGHRIEHAENLAQVRAATGLYLSNELVDAFPFHRFRFENETWHELRILLDGEKFTERPFATSQKLPDPPRDGFTFELCPTAQTWIRELAGIFQNDGHFLCIDYGMTREELLSPERRDGTMRCYRSHRATDDPFDAIGETDITRQVDFTQLIETAEQAGFTVHQFRDQGHFLIETARDWLLSLEGRPPEAEQAALIRQFQTLTHPGLMGRQFKVLEFSS